MASKERDKVTPRESTRQALALVRAAKCHLKAAGAVRALVALRRAEKSIEGADRHAERMADKEARA